MPRLGVDKNLDGVYFFRSGRLFFCLTFFDLDAIISQPRHAVNSFLEIYFQFTRAKAGGL
jgi:hypothetical protein